MNELRVVPFLVSEVRLPPDEQVILRREWWPSYAHAVIHRDGVDSVERLRALDPVRVHFAHDRSAWER